MYIRVSSETSRYLPCRSLEGFLIEADVRKNVSKGSVETLVRLIKTDRLFFINGNKEQTETLCRGAVLLVTSFHIQRRLLNFLEPPCTGLLHTYIRVPNPSRVASVCFTLI